MEKLSPKTKDILLERFGSDDVVDRVTTENNIPYVRIADVL